MKIIITGAKGQLGTDLKKVLKGHELRLTDKDEVDVTHFPGILKLITEFEPDVIIHGAAYTNVDGCESDQTLAYQVNAIGTQNLAIAAQQVGSALLYVSTDFVFDGTKGSPYLEFDPTNPLSVYGSSKLAGERYVTTLLNKYYIVRTAWLYGHGGHNFVKSILKLADEKDELSVVDDQIGCPTYTLDLASVIGDIVESKEYGIYHAVNRGHCSWYDFASEILRLAGKNSKVNAISSEELNRPAKRPAYSVLDDFSLRSRGFTRFRPWEEGLAAYFNEA